MVQKSDSAEGLSLDNTQLDGPKAWPGKLSHPPLSLDNPDLDVLRAWLNRGQFWTFHLKQPSWRSPNHPFFPHLQQKKPFCSCPCQYTGPTPNSITETANKTPDEWSVWISALLISVTITLWKTAQGIFGFRVCLLSLQTEGCIIWQSSNWCIRFHWSHVGCVLEGYNILKCATASLISPYFGTAPWKEIFLLCGVSDTVPRHSRE